MTSTIATNSATTATTAATTNGPTTATTTPASDVSAGPTAPSVPALPQPGVYRYRTTGRESIDALGGTAHDYPADTTITVTPAGCGVRLRWDALVERWDEWELCATPAGIELQRDARQYHQFYGQDDEEAIQCDRAVLVVPVDATPSPPVDQRCTLGGDAWLPVWQVLGRDRRTVGGATVDVTQVRRTVEDDDDYWEHNTMDLLLADDGLPVAVDVVTSSRSPSPVGGVVYEETYHLELVSLTPSR
jgi:hypothetical protein